MAKHLRVSCIRPELWIQGRVQGVWRRRLPDIGRFIVLRLYCLAKRNASRPSTTLTAHNFFAEMRLTLDVTKNDVRLAISVFFFRCSTEIIVIRGVYIGLGETSTLRRGSLTSHDSTVQLLRCFLEQSKHCGNKIIAYEPPVLHGFSYTYSVIVILASVNVCAWSLSML